MIEESATVVSTDGDHAWVEAIRSSSCQSCSSGGCGTGTLAKYLGRKSSQIYVSNPIDAESGSRVIIGLDEREMLTGALRLYLVPILTLFGMALLVEWLLAPAQELFVVISGGIGLAVGLGFNRLLDSRQRFSGASILRRDEVGIRIEPKSTGVNPGKRD